MSGSFSRRLSNPRAALLFADEPPRATLSLVSNQAFGSGIVVLEYGRAGQ